MHTHSALEKMAEMPAPAAFSKPTHHFTPGERRFFISLTTFECLTANKD
jgi:hypothetical protein